MTDSGSSQANHPHGSLLCPKCIAPLDLIEIYAIPVERCPACGGIWLDEGELELIQEREKAKASWLTKLIKRTASKD
jgi:Zn-finger nucleic acid-binding protein